MDDFVIKSLKLVELIKKQWYQDGEGDFISSHAARAICQTFTTCGVYMKEQGKLNLAIKYFKDVVEIESESPALQTELAQTYVNICSIYSQMNKHEIALQYCQSALKVLEKEYSD